MSNRRRIYQKWYLTHGEEYNRNRREKYKNGGLRKTTPTRSRTAYVHYRVYDGVEGVVFPLGAVAKQVGKSYSTLASWASKGLIPDPVFGGKQRMYSAKQVNLIKGLRVVYDTYRFNPPKLAETLGLEKTRIQNNWSDVW